MSKLTPDSALELLFDPKLLPESVRDVGNGLHVSLLSFGHYPERVESHVHFAKHRLSAVAATLVKRL